MKLDARAIRIANDIVEELFTNGNRQKAERLVLEIKGGQNSIRDGGGWAKQPARDVIAKHITRLLQERQAE